MRTKFIIAYIVVFVLVFIPAIPINAQEESTRIETKEGTNIAWFKTPMALPGHPLAGKNGMHPTIKIDPSNEMAQQLLRNLSK